MKRRNPAFNLVFSILGGLLVLFVVLPLVSTLLSTTPGAFLDSFRDPQVLRSIGLTFGAGAISTTLAAVTGIPLAYLLARRMFHGKHLLEAIINLPVVIPHTAAGIALLLVFGRQGMLGKWLYPLGITFTDSLAGIVIAMLFVSLPFLFSTVRLPLKVAFLPVGGPARLPCDSLPVERAPSPRLGSAGRPGPRPGRAAAPRGYGRGKGQNQGWFSHGTHRKNRSISPFQNEIIGAP